MIAESHPVVDRESLSRAARDGDGRGVGRVGDVAHAARCDSGPVGRAGHHPHDVPRTGAADRREPDHLSARDDDDVRAGREDGARLFDVRRFVRLYPVRGRHRSLLGALSCARVSEPGASAACRRRRKRHSAPTRPASAGSTSTRSSIAAERTISRSCAALQDWFLKYELKSVPNVSRGRLGRRHGEAVPDRASTPDRLRASTCIARPQVMRSRAESANQENGRLGAGAGRSRVHGARVGLPAVAR